MARTKQTARKAAPVSLDSVEGKLDYAKSGSKKPSADAAADKDKDWSKVPRKCHDMVFVVLFVVWWLSTK